MPSAHLGPRLNGRGLFGIRPCRAPLYPACPSLVESVPLLARRRWPRREIMSLDVEVTEIEIDEDGDGDTDVRIIIIEDRGEESPD